MITAISSNKQKKIKKNLEKKKFIVYTQLCCDIGN